MTSTHASASAEGAGKRREKTALSVLFLSYNRTDLLTAAVQAIRPALASAKDLEVEIVISDDGSAAEHREAIAKLGADTVVWAPQNMGLSHNHNKGLRACRHDLILSLQDDWRLAGPVETIHSALLVLADDPEVGAVNFFPPSGEIANERRRLPSGVEYVVFANDGQTRRRQSGDRAYSDRPHIKRKAFVLDMGDYREDLPMTEAELEFQRRVACQQRWRIAHLCHAAPFEHIGEDRSLNPSNIRARQLESMYRLPIFGPAYRLMRTAARYGRDALLQKNVR